MFWYYFLKWKCVIEIIDSQDIFFVIGKKLIEVY